MYRSCSLSQLVIKNIDKAKSILEMNQYPPSVYNSIIRKIFPKLFLAILLQSNIMRTCPDYVIAFISNSITGVILHKNSSNHCINQILNFLFNALLQPPSCEPSYPASSVLLIKCTAVELFIRLLVRGATPYMSDKLFDICQHDFGNMVG